MEKSKETVGQNGFWTGDLWATSPDFYKLIYPVPGWWLSQYNNFIFYIFFNFFFLPGGGQPNATIPYIPCNQHSIKQIAKISD